MRLIYQRLTDYILQKLPKAYHGNFYSWLEDGAIVDQGKQLTANGEILFYLQYKAELLFHEFPFLEISPLVLMTYIKLWLDENDVERYRLDDHQIEFDLDITDDKTADLSFTIEFNEPIFITQVEKKGEIEIDGQQYNFAEPETQFAETIEFFVNGKQISDTVTADSFTESQ